MLDARTILAAQQAQNRKQATVGIQRHGIGSTIDNRLTLTLVHPMQPQNKRGSTKGIELTPPLRR